MSRRIAAVIRAKGDIQNTRYLCFLLCKNQATKLFQWDMMIVLSVGLVIIITRIWNLVNLKLTCYTTFTSNFRLIPILLSFLQSNFFNTYKYSKSFNSHCIYSPISMLDSVFRLLTSLCHTRKSMMCLKCTKMSWNRLFQYISIQKCTKKTYFSRFQYVSALCTFSDVYNCMGQHCMDLHQFLVCLFLCLPAIHICTLYQA